MQKIRANTSLEKLRNLPPLFEAKGTVTAGNACPINDGAALLLMMSREKCQALELQPIMRVVDAQAAGVEPNYLGMGPVPAVQKILKRQHLKVADLDVVEFNEAFSSQVLASLNSQRGATKRSVSRCLPSIKFIFIIKRDSQS